MKWVGWRKLGEIRIAPHSKQAANRNISQRKNKTLTSCDTETALANPLQRRRREVDAILQDTNDSHTAIICAQLALVISTGSAENVSMGGVELKFDVGEITPGVACFREDALGALAQTLQKRKREYFIHCQ